MNPTRTIAALVAAAALTTIASPAFATDTPAPEFVTVAWVIDNPDSIWEIPQHTPVHVTGASVDFAGVQALVGCGKFYQLDGYIASDITDALIAGGVLYGPNNPAEDLAYGAPGTEATGNPWAYFTAPDCSETVCVDSFTQQTTTFRFAWDGSASTRIDTSSISATLTEPDAITAGCYVPPVVDPLPPVQPPVVAELAHSGPNDVPLLLGLGTVLLIGGLIPLIYVTRRKES